MKLTVLTENAAGEGHFAEHGLSFLIEIDNQKILFDTGASDVFLKNAELLGLNIQKEIQTIVLSHGHWDHAGGLKYLHHKILLTHPAAFNKRYRKKDRSEVGISLSKSTIQKNYELQESTEPVKISEHLFYLGQIPRNNNFESQTTAFELESGEEDFVDDDSALAAIVDDEIVVISGCSHSGICNICEHAKKVCGKSSIKSVVGGFHLMENNRQTQNTIDYFQANRIKNVIPSHCTALPALEAFYKVFHSGQLKTGMTLTF